MKYCLMGTVALIALCCTQKKKPTSSLDTLAYQQTIEDWHTNRVNDLKAPNGWLNLIGLFWLEEGINTFGSDSSNNIIFPARAAKKMGYFIVKQETALLEVNRGIVVTTGGKLITSHFAFHPDSARTPQFESDSLRWNIIERDDQLGVRLRDLASEEIKSFKGIERYPVSTRWRIAARFEQADSSKTLMITNIIGQTTAQSTPGTIVFTVDDQAYRLDVLKGNEREFFVIFSDVTTGKETYGAGRYLYVEKPDADGNLIIDFNKAYNPPCAFTAYATCPLPPKQNHLPIAVTAGEKNYGEYHAH